MKLPVHPVIVLYMAHPVSGGLWRGARQKLNDLNVRLNPLSIAVMAPWLPQVEELGNDDSEDTRDFWLEADLRVLRGFDGVVGVGDIVSDGMVLEMSEASLLGIPARYCENLYKCNCLYDWALENFHGLY